MNVPSYRNYMLGVLLLILAFNNVDRLALGLLLQEIKIDLALTDTHLGILTGIAFALFYSIMGIPIARWADRGNRVLIISLTTILWSVALGLSSLAGSFLQLLLVRVGVAVGEAGCVPPAHSLIADYFKRSERPRAVAIYMLGIPLSVVIGYFFAGWINEFYGWRITFIAIGVPGIVLGAVTWLTLREPRRQVAALEVAAAEFSTREILLILWRNVTFRHLLLGYSVACFFGYGIAQWKPAFFIRSFGLQTGELGTWLMIIYGVGGFAGTYIGGVLATRYASRNEALQLRAIAYAYCAFGVISACIYVSTSVYLAFSLLALSLLGYYLTMGPFFATLQSLVPTRMRAMSIALVYLFANLIGMGLGPLAAGILSDMFRQWAGEESLRYALLTLSPGYLWCAWHLHRAGRTVAADLEAAQRTDHSESATDVLEKGSPEFGKQSTASGRSPRTPVISDC